MGVSAMIDKTIDAFIHEVPGGSAAAEVVGQAAGSAMDDPTGIGGLY